MRFKFRAWDKSNNSFCPSPLWLLDPSGEVRWQYDNKIASDRLEVQQWTGLLDNNGREIYEGDIVKVDEDNLSLKFKVEQPSYNRGIVKWIRGMFCLCQIKIGSYLIHDYFMCDFCPGQVEIIGNIFENPELLSK